jgi:hypothetical protein
MCIKLGPESLVYGSIVKPGGRGPAPLANVWENGDVQEHSGSYSLGASGEAGD